MPSMRAEQVLGLVIHQWYRHHGQRAAPIFHAAFAAPDVWDDLLARLRVLIDTCLARELTAQTPTTTGTTVIISAE